MRLSDVSIRKARPEARAKRLFDGGGLYIEIAPSGGKWWRFKYRFHGKEKRISLGVYPDVGLRAARERRDKARTALSSGTDPALLKRAILSKGDASGSFESVAREWVALNSKRWSKDYSALVLRRFEKDVFPWLGRVLIADISASQLLPLIRRIEKRGVHETAHRILQYSGRVFRYAVATGRATRDPSRDLAGALTPVRKRHHASLTDPRDVAELLRAIEGYRGTFTTKCALRIAPLLFVRPGELRGAEWGEIDFQNASWRIPAHRMKMKRQHLVPLSRQALAILRELHTITGGGRYLFPSTRSQTRTMSENTLNAALRRLDYTNDEMTAHGFRSMASTLLNEQGWNRDAIERQLAHRERDSVRAAYNFAEHLAERRNMMQAWADYLDSLFEKRGGEELSGTITS